MATKKAFARPKATTPVQTPSDNIDEATVDALIKKGGSVATSGSTINQVKNVQLRLSVTDLNRIDEARTARLVQPSRHAWLLEAIYEKLERE